MIGIEASHYRIVNDDLDPILVESIFIQLIECQDIQTWQVVIEQANFYIAPVVFDKPYFWQTRHEGDAQYSCHYADIYMGYLSSIWGKKLLLQRLWQAYLMAIQGKRTLWYWQKQCFGRFWVQHMMKRTISQINRLSLMSLMGIYQISANALFSHLFVLSSKSLRIWLFCAKMMTNH